LRFNNLLLRYIAIGKYFDKTNIDVIQFQEVFFYANLLLFKRTLQNYPYYQYKKTFFGPKAGLVTFSRFPLEFVRYTNFQNNCASLPLIKKVISYLSPRGMLLTKTQDDNLHFLNVHLSAVSNGDWSEKSIYAQRLTNELISFNTFLTCLDKKSITIISGDFNTAKESVFYAQMQRSPLLTDIFAKDNKPTYHSEFLPKGENNNYIDYLFIYGNKNNYKIINTIRIFTDKVQLSKNKKNFVSGHIGLAAIIKIKKEDVSPPVDGIR
jgi:hypothetical protein